MGGEVEVETNVYQDQEQFKIFDHKRPGYPVAAAGFTKPATAQHYTYQTGVEEEQDS